MGVFLLFGEKKKKVKFLGTTVSLEVIKDIYLSFVLLLRFLVCFFFFFSLSGEPARQRSLSPSGEFFVLLNTFSQYYSTFFGSALLKLKYNIKVLNIFFIAIMSHRCSHSCKSCIRFFLKTFCIK